MRTHRFTALPAAMVLFVLAACSSDPVTTQPGSTDTPAATTAAPAPTSNETQTGDASPTSVDPTTADASSDAQKSSTPVDAGALMGTTGTITLQDTVPPAEGLLVWGTPMLDGAEIDVFDQDGYNILTMPSTCRLTTYQGVFVDPDAGGSDAAGSDQVLETVVAGYDAATDLQSEPIDPITVPVVGSEGEIELAGASLTFQAEGKDWVDTLYYRGMPTADATLFTGMSCEQQIVDADGSEIDQILDQIQLNVVQP